MGWWLLLNVALAAEPEALPPDRSMSERERREIQRCYEQGLQHTPTLRGRLAVETTIEQGRVLSVVEDTSLSSFPSASVVACVQSRIKQWVYAPATQGVVYYTFAMEAADGAIRRAARKRARQQARDDRPGEE